MTTFVCFSLYVCLLLLIFTKASFAQPASATGKRDNYVILLDLSDRLLTAGQVQRDKELIRVVMDKFVESVKKKYFIGSADRFKIVMAPQKGSTVDASAYDAALYLDMGKLPVARKKHVTSLMEEMYRQVEKLYAEASVNKAARQYQGADIWGYFHQSLAYDFVPDKKYADTNHLVILTDGYLDFESYAGRRQAGNRYASTQFVATLAAQKESWRKAFEGKDYGVMPVTNAQWPPVRIYVAEIDPRKDYHFEILEATWHKWLLEMQLQQRLFLRKGSLAVSREQLGLIIR